MDVGISRAPTSCMDRRKGVIELAMHNNYRKHFRHEVLHLFALGRRGGNVIASTSSIVMAKNNKSISLPSTCWGADVCVWGGGGTGHVVKACPALPAPPCLLAPEP